MLCTKWQVREHCYDMQVDCVKDLLEAGANVKVFAVDDMNAMHFAAQKGHAEVVRQLLNAGVTPLS